MKKILIHISFTIDGLIQPFFCQSKKKIINLSNQQLAGVQSPNHFEKKLFYNYKWFNARIVCKLPKGHYNIFNLFLNSLVSGCEKLKNTLIIFQLDVF